MGQRRRLAIVLHVPIAILFLKKHRVRTPTQVTRVSEKFGTGSRSLGDLAPGNTIGVSMFLRISRYNWLQICFAQMAVYNTGLLPPNPYPFSEKSPSGRLKKY